MALHHRIIAHATGSQSHVIVATVLLAFFVWVTLAGHLRRYLNDLGIGTPPPSSAAAMSLPGVSTGIGALNPGGVGSILGNPAILGTPSIATPPIFGN